MKQMKNNVLRGADSPDLGLCIRSTERGNGLCRTLYF